MVNDRVCKAVIDSGMKQKFIADHIGVSEPTFSAMMSGRRKIDVDEFFGICEVLKMTPDNLYNYPRQQAGA